ncbi:MAG: 4-alpha-glucanotransferase, partial [Gammaproteobacteria bacterium]|nr:4-alpha-glucanotransferase [Gammaproteobacteria bacterium]
KTISSGNPLDKRRAGILLHPVSLPGSQRNGDLGSNAYWFVDFLAHSGMTVWQTLPLGPTHEDGSPYQCQSAHAGNPLLISLEALTKKGWLENNANPSDREAPEYRAQCLCAAHEGFRQRAGKEDREAYERFLGEHAAWLDDYALFHVLKNVHHGKAWQDWAAPLRDRNPEALTEARKRFTLEIEQCRFEQFL